jgi:hypothetical protein
MLSATPYTATPDDDTALAGAGLVRPAGSAA